MKRPSLSVKTNVSVVVWGVHGLLNGGVRWTKWCVIRAKVSWTKANVKRETRSAKLDEDERQALMVRASVSTWWQCSFWADIDFFRAEFCLKLSNGDTIKAQKTYQPNWANCFRQIQGFFWGQLDCIIALFDTTQCFWNFSWVTFLPKDGPPAYLAFTLVYGRQFRRLENLPVLVLA